MTVIIPPTCRIRCDDVKHDTIREFDVQCGTQVTAQFALISEGWRVDSTGNKHKCPDCVRRWLRAN